MDILENRDTLHMQNMECVPLTLLVEQTGNVSCTSISIDTRAGLESILPRYFVGVLDTKNLGFTKDPRIICYI